jgi:hypothetical protein
MMTQALRERLAEDVGAWLTDGLISESTHDLLRERYDARRFGIAGAIKYLGIAGGLLAFFGLIGLAGAFGGEVLGALLLLGVGGALSAAGIRLSNDSLGRYPASSKVVLALGVVAATLGIAMAVHLVDARGGAVAFVTAMVALPVVGFLAYRFHNIFLLILGLVGFFHWVGSWPSIFGLPIYYRGWDLQDPRLLCAAALAAIGVGIWHETKWRERTGRFYLAYEALGLIYLNLALLVLSIDGGRGLWMGRGYSDMPISQLVWTGVFAAAAIGLIVAGARLHNSLFTAFGVTAFAVNLAACYCELFWRRTHEGVFFLVGGLALLGAGFGCELLLQRIRSTTR